MSGDIDAMAVEVIMTPAKITMAILQQAIMNSLLHRKTAQVSPHPPRHVTNPQNHNSIVIPDEDIRAFKMSLARHGVDFHAMVDNTGQHRVFFKGKNTDAIYSALEKYIADINISTQTKKSAKEVMAEATEKADRQRAAQRAAMVVNKASVRTVAER